MVSTQASNGDQTRAATPDAGAVRHDNIVMIDAVTPRLRRARAAAASNAQPRQKRTAERVQQGGTPERYPRGRNTAPQRTD